MRAPGARMVVWPTLVAAAVGTVVRQQGASDALQLSNDTSTNLRKIVPKLDPKSDQKFFGKDYPHDKSPPPKHLAFGHPFPHVQDTRDFDKDYIKDENADGGEWQAQEDYDRLRHKIDKAKQEVEEAKAEEAKRKEKWMSAVQGETEAEKKAKEAEWEADHAKEKLDRSKKKVEELIGADGSKQVGGKIGKQVGNVNKEITDLEGCQKQLREAQEKLKKLLEEREEKRQRILHDQNESGIDRDYAEGEYDAARSAQYEQMDEALKRSVKEQEEVHAQALKEFQMSEEEVKKTEAELDKYALKLRAIRAKEDSDGGVYVKSGALASSPAVLALLALMSRAV
mmetsp:Transcript_26235/g.74616  ORF Transcript_26235/g.74616 Transcript_26235/m.74616 type:complete len:340 (+) Transcript_26235:60-1079(+)